MPNNETDDELGPCAGCGVNLDEVTELNPGDARYIDVRDTVGFTPDILCFGAVEDIDPVDGEEVIRYPLVAISDNILPKTVDYIWCSDNCFAQHLLRMLEAERAAAV